MNKLKTLPWTQILLFLLLISTLMNYRETRRVHAGFVWVMLNARSEQSMAQTLKDIKANAETANDSLERIEHNTGCIEDPYRGGCSTFRLIHH